MIRICSIKRPERAPASPALAPATERSWLFRIRDNQDISVAGRQRGLDGARSGLFFTLAQLVKGQSPENLPTWIVLENVKNLLSIHGGWDFATVLDTLASLGYHVEYGLHCRLPTSWSRTRTQNISCPRRQWQSSYPTHRWYAGAARL